MECNWREVWAVQWVRGLAHAAAEKGGKWKGWKNSRDIVYNRGGDGGEEGADYGIGVHFVKLTNWMEAGGSSLREAEGGSRWWLHLKNAEQKAL